MACPCHTIDGQRVLCHRIAENRPAAVEARGADGRTAYRDIRFMEAVAVKIYIGRRHCAGTHRIRGEPVFIIPRGLPAHGIILQRQRIAALKQPHTLRAGRGCRPCGSIFCRDLRPIKTLRAVILHLEHGISGVNPGAEDKIHLFKFAERCCTIVAGRNPQRISGYIVTASGTESSIEMGQRHPVQSAERNGIARCSAAARSIAARYDARDRCVALKHELIVRCTSRCCHIKGAKNIPGPYDAVDGQLIIVHIARCGRVDANGGKR